MKTLMLIAIIAFVIDISIGEFPCKHPVEYIGSFIKQFERFFYKDSVFRGGILVIVLILTVGIISILLQFVLLKLKLPYYIYVLLIGILSSTGLASKTLREYVNNVLVAPKEDMRKELSLLVSRNTELLDDNKVFSSLIESHSENLSDGVTAPLFYLVLFGFTGIMLYKTVSTMDSMIGYKNDRYKNFGKIAAKLDDILNFIPARITGVLIWLLSTEKCGWKALVENAKVYSSSPNAGYPVAAAAFYLGVKLGGPVYYGDMLVNKAEIGVEKNNDYKKSALNFLKLHLKVEKILLLVLILFYIALKITH